MGLLAARRHLVRSVRHGAAGSARMQPAHAHRGRAVGYRSGEFAQQTTPRSPVPYQLETAAMSYTSHNS
jgi:hypothetical protein